MAHLPANFVIEQYIRTAPSTRPVLTQSNSYGVGDLFQPYEWSHSDDPTLPRIMRFVKTIATKAEELGWKDATLMGLNGDPSSGIIEHMGVPHKEKTIPVKVRWTMEHPDGRILHIEYSPYEIGNLTNDLDDAEALYPEALFGS